LYISKFYVYVFADLMHNRFVRYNIVNLFVLFLNVVVIWLLVDFLGFYASVSSAIVTFVFFVLRFVVLSKFGLIKDEPSSEIRTGHVL